MITSFLSQGCRRVTSTGNYSRSRRLFGSVLCIWKTEFALHSSPEWIHSRGSLRLIANLKAFHWDTERRKQSAPAVHLHERDNAAQGQGGSDLRPVMAGPALTRAANGSKRCIYAKAVMLIRYLCWKQSCGEAGISPLNLRLIHFSFQPHLPSQTTDLLVFCEGLTGCC